MAAIFPPNGATQFIRIRGALAIRFLLENEERVRNRTTLFVSYPCSEARLCSALSAGTLGVSFRRQGVLGNFIVDFLAPWVQLVVEVEGALSRAARRGGRSAGQQARRLGYRVLRIPAALAVHDLRAALELVRAAL